MGASLDNYFVGNCYYYVQCEYEGNNLDGNVAPSFVPFTSPSKGGDDQKWLFEPTANTNEYKIKNKSRGMYLTNNTPPNYNPFLAGENNTDAQVWFVNAVGKDKYTITNKQSGEVLTSNVPPEYNVFVGGAGGGSRQKWDIYLADAVFDIAVDDISYHKTPSKGDSGIQPLMIAEKVYKNTSDATITQKVAASRSVSTNFSWTLTESLSISRTDSANVSIEALGVGVSSSITMALSLSATQSQSKTTNESYDVSDEITIPPNASVKAKSIIYMADDFQTDFTLNYWISGKCDTTEGSEKAMSSNDIKTLLKNTGFKGKVLNNTSNSVLVSVTGTFVGTYGFETAVVCTNMESGKTTEQVLEV